MTCDDALLLLLEWDLTALDREAGTPLAQHLAGCAKCQRVAGQLAADSTQLIAALRAAPAGAIVRAARPRRWVVCGALAAAGVAALLFGRGGAAPVEPPMAPAVGAVAAIPPAEALTQPSSSPVAASAGPESAAAPPRSAARASLPTTATKPELRPVLAVAPQPAAEPVTVRPLDAVASVRATPYRAVALEVAPLSTDPPAAVPEAVRPASTHAILQTSNPNIIVVWQQTP